MSEPTRYRVADNQAQLTLGGGVLVVDPAGPLVEYADYARLKAEVERLKNNCDCLDRELDREIDKTAMLCGQVERLLKAGDKLVEVIQDMDVIIDMDSNHQEVSEWADAKEGKPSA